MSDFSLIKQLSQIAADVDLVANQIYEYVQTDDTHAQLVESADKVLGILAAKLRTGALSDSDAQEYAQLYASLSLLGQNDVRHAFNIDINTPKGKEQFANIVNGVGENPSVTRQVKQVAVVNGQSHYNQILNDLKNFDKMDAMKQQQYINSINKLRIGYEQVKNRMKASSAVNPAPNPSAAGVNPGMAASSPVGGSGAMSFA